METIGQTIGTYSAPDGYKLSYRHWKGSPGKPVIIYLHGIEGHSQWFEGTASQLNQMGMSVYAPDRRGAGLNTESRGDFERYDQVIDDVVAMLNIASGQGPLFLLGNCWGAKTAVVLTSRWQQGLLTCPDINGLILTSPALVTKVDLTFPEKIQVTFNWLSGSKQPIPIPVTPAMFTDNQSYLDYINKDTNRLTHATGAFFAQTFFLTRRARQAAPTITLPLLLLQAGYDDIVDIEAIRKWFSQVKSKDKTFKSFDWMFHSLDFDARANEYVETLSTWINAHLTPEEK